MLQIEQIEFFLHVMLKRRNRERKSRTLQRKKQKFQQTNKQTKNAQHLSNAFNRENPKSLRHENNKCYLFLFIRIDSRC